MRRPFRHPIDVFFRRQGKAFVADVPGPEDCSAQGKTPVEAVREVMVAIRAWLAGSGSLCPPGPDPGPRTMGP
jgi:predicted RNase H-like HicB family nuclease